MKIILVTILMLMFSCRSNEKKGYELHFDENGPNLISKSESELTCPLLNLPKTTNYQQHLNSLKDLQHDSLIEVENKEIGKNLYQTFIDHKENEIHVWLIRKNMYDEKIDSLLIHYSDNVEYLNALDSTFDLINCLIVGERRYWTEEEPECREVIVIEL